MSAMLSVDRSRRQPTAATWVVCFILVALATMNSVVANTNTVFVDSVWRGVVTDLGVHFAFPLNASHGDWILLQASVNLDLTPGTVRLSARLNHQPSLVPGDPDTQVSEGSTASLVIANTDPGGVVFAFVSCPGQPDTQVMITASSENGPIPGGDGRVDLALSDYDAGTSSFSATVTWQAVDPPSQFHAYLLIYAFSVAGQSRGVEDLFDEWHDVDAISDALLDGGNDHVLVNSVCYNSVCSASVAVAANRAAIFSVLSQDATGFGSYATRATYACSPDGSDYCGLFVPSTLAPDGGSTNGAGSDDLTDGIEGYPIPAFTLLLVFVATMLIVSLLLLGCVYCARQYMTDLAAEEHFQRRTRARIRQAFNGPDPDYEVPIITVPASFFGSSGSYEDYSKDEPDLIGDTSAEVDGSRERSGSDGTGSDEDGSGSGLVLPDVAPSGAVLDADEATGEQNLVDGGDAAGDRVAPAPGAAQLVDDVAGDGLAPVTPLVDGDDVAGDGLARVAQPVDRDAAGDGLAPVAQLVDGDAASGGVANATLLVDGGASGDGLPVASLQSRVATVAAPPPP